MKEKNMATTQEYRAVLDDLTKQKAQLLFRAGEIDTAVAALRRLMPDEDVKESIRSQPPPPIQTSGKFAGISNRWAILWLLAEDATGPMTTGQIADALMAGGMMTSGKNYAGNISAVLSGMNHDKGEVISQPDGWVISEKGKDVWIHIKSSNMLQRQQAISANATLQ